MKITFLKTAMGAILLSGFILAGCQKDHTIINNPPTTIDSSKITVQYNPSFNLSNYSTIAVSDSVLSAGTSDTFELNSTEAVYVQAFKDSLAAKGLNVVALTSNPDLVLNVTRISNTSNGVIDSTGYWNNYSTRYNPSLYGLGNATYTNSFTSANSVGTGVLSFELLDLKNATATNQISILWNGQVSGSQLFQTESLARNIVGILLEKTPLHNP